MIEIKFAKGDIHDGVALRAQGITPSIAMSILASSADSGRLCDPDTLKLVWRESVSMWTAHGEFGIAHTPEQSLKDKVARLLKDLDVFEMDGPTDSRIRYDVIRSCGLKEIERTHAKSFETADEAVRAYMPHITEALSERCTIIWRESPSIEQNPAEFGGEFFVYSRFKVLTR